jgi:hypothetical protein
MVKQRVIQNQEGECRRRPPGDFVFVTTEMNFGARVKNAPYSAQAVTETTQTLVTAIAS